MASRSGLTTWPPPAIATLARPRLVPLPPAGADRAEKIEELLSRDGVLTTDAALDLCAAYDIPVAEWSVVDDAEGPLFAASMMGYPVTLKALSSGISHKSDVGAVVLDVADPEMLQEAFEALLARVSERLPEAELKGVLVQRMRSGGREVILGRKRDPSFEPVVMFGLGGIYVEVFEEVSFRLAPVTHEMATHTIAEVRGSRLLHGVRGQAPADVDAVIQALAAFSRLLVGCPEILEIDVNPLLVFEQDAAAVDAQVVMQR